MMESIGDHTSKGISKLCHRHSALLQGGLPRRGGLASPPPSLVPFGCSASCWLLSLSLSPLLVRVAHMHSCKAVAGFASPALFMSLGETALEAILAALRLKCCLFHLPIIEWVV